METNDKSSVMVELYDLTLTERKDDRFGRVVTAKSLSEKDLVSMAISRRTDLNATTLKASMEILKQIAIEQIANGASVNFGLGYFSLSVNGVFIGNSAKWDPSQHSLVVKATPVAELRNAVKAITVDVRGMAVAGPVINKVIDVSSGEENTALTPGGGANLEGSKIKIDGDAPNVGISLVNHATEEVVSIPKTSILVNEPSRITFLIPASLPAGDYTINLCTQYSTSSQQMKEPRSYIFDHILSVVSR